MRELRTESEHRGRHNSSRQQTKNAETSPLRSASSAPKTANNPKQSTHRIVAQHRHLKHNTDRSAEGQPASRSTTLTKQEHRNNNSTSDPKEKRQRKGTTSTWICTAKAVSLFIAWVLISTTTLCACSHHTTIPTIPPPLTSTLSYQLLTQSPTLHQLQSFHPLYTLKPHSIYTALLHPAHHQLAPPPHSACVSTTATRSPTPTNHKSKHTNVSKNMRTYQQESTPTTIRKTCTSLCISLPQTSRRRHSPPPHTAKSQTHQIAQPNPAKRHPHQTDLPKTDRQLPPYLTAFTKIHRHHCPLTSAHPQPTTTHPNLNDRHTKSCMPQRTHTQTIDCHTAQSNAHSYPANCHTSSRTIQHTLLLKTYYYTPTHPATPHSAHQNTERRHTEARTIQHNAIPQTDDQPANPPKISQYTSPIRHSRSHKLIPPSTKQNYHPPIPTPQSDTTYAPSQCTNLDRQRKLHTQQPLQIPPITTLFLTHSLTLPPHLNHTTMAPNNDDSHKVAHYTRSNPNTNQDCRTRTKGATSSNGAGNAAPQTAGRGGDEEAASLGGAGTRSRSGGRRRALITEYSDDEDREIYAPPASQLVLIKEKAPLFHDHDMDMQLADVYLSTEGAHFNSPCRTMSMPPSPQID